MVYPVFVGQRASKKGAQAVVKRLEKEGYRVHVRQLYNGMFEITRSIYRNDRLI